MPKATGQERGKADARVAVGFDYPSAEPEPARWPHDFASRDLGGPPVCACGEHGGRRVENEPPLSDECPVRIKGDLLRARNLLLAAREELADLGGSLPHVTELVWKIDDALAGRKS